MDFGNTVKTCKPNTQTALIPSRKNSTTCFHAKMCYVCSCLIIDVKVEVKMEDESEGAGERQQDNQQDTAGQPEQVKTEGERGGHYGRKRPYEENRGYSYYEHREEKRWASTWFSKLTELSTLRMDKAKCMTINTLVLLYRSRTPQPPAEDEEENIDDTLVTIDTCKYGTLNSVWKKKLVSVCCLWLFINIRDYGKLDCCSRYNHLFTTCFC